MRHTVPHQPRNSRPSQGRETSICRAQEHNLGLQCDGKSTTDTTRHRPNTWFCEKFANLRVEANTDDSDSDPPV